MDSPGKNPKRVRLNSGGDAQSHQTWQSCHSGFEDDMIENECLKTSATSRSRTKGRKGTKLPIRKSTEQALIPDKEIEIDWESSSSEDEDADHQTGPSVPPGRPSPTTSKRKTSEWLSPIVKPDLLRAFRVKGVEAEEETVSIDAEKIPENTNAVDDDEVNETRISDYESPDECATPTGHHVSNKGLPSSTVTPSQSPSISSYGQSTQESATSVSPLTSSQWVNMFKRGQQTTPTKASMPGSSHTEETEGKDSAKKKMKFASRGLAERLQKLINREKSDVAFWQHQSLPQQRSQTGVCHIKVNSMTATRGLFVAHCSNLDHLLDESQSSQGGLPEKVVVLFSRKTVADKHLQVGSSVAIHPPWQKLILPETSQTVLLCTYFCQVIESGGGDGAPSSSTDTTESSQQIRSTPRRVFRPNRLFSENKAFPSLSLNESISVQSQFWDEKIAESLLEILSAKGPNFDFEFNLRALVLRVCEMVSTRTPQSVAGQTWMVLAKDSDGTIFEVHLTCDANQELKSLQGKFVDFKQLKVSQRVNKMRSPGLFSMIDSYSKSFASKDAREPGKSEVAVPVQNISFVLMGTDFDLSTEDINQNFLSNYSPHPTKVYNLYDIQKQEQVLRVSFHAMLLHSTSMDALNPGEAAAPKRQGRGFLLLLFVTDPSLSSTTGPESTDNTDQSNYMCIKKLSSCAIKWTEGDFEKACRSVVFFEDVFMKEDGSLVLDCYSTITLDTFQESTGAETSVQSKEILLKNFEQCLSFSYAELSEESSENTLASLSGTMEGVDESTAYSWPICNICESNQLGNGDSGNKLYCPFCAKEVTSPVTRIHLEILVKCPSLKTKSTAKVKLKQQTIKDLFGEPSASEPFDLKRILGKPFPRSGCFVRKVSEQDEGQRVIQLDET